MYMWLFDIAWALAPYLLNSAVGARTLVALRGVTLNMRRPTHMVSLPLTIKTDKADEHEATGDARFAQRPFAAFEDEQRSTIHNYVVDASPPTHDPQLCCGRRTPHRYRRCLFAKHTGTTVDQNALYEPSPTL